MCGKTRECRTGRSQSKRAQRSRRPASTRPKGATAKRQGSVAPLAKGMPLPAGRALPWRFGVTLMVCSSTGQDTRQKLRALRASRILQSGKLIAHATSTVPGMAASPLCPQSVRALQQFKQRQGPFLFIADSIHTAVHHTRYLPHTLRQAMRQSWPGNTTLVVPGCPGLPCACYSKGKIALRVDADITSRRLAKLSGGLILSSSLNRRGQSLQSPNHRLRMRWHRHIGGIISNEKQNNTPSILLLWKTGHLHALR